jgi:crotonobetainyl-CoA:carnitine CoA-transferase CaiB-like acyl-CoA transferase
MPRPRDSAVPPYADKLALDLTIQAMSGLMSTTGEKGGRPLKAGVPVADFMSGAHLYGAIVTALYERERTGRGRVLEVSMLESLFATLLPAAGHVYASNTVPQRTGNRHVADSYVPFEPSNSLMAGWRSCVPLTHTGHISLRRWAVQISATARSCVACRGGWHASTQ